ncbi:MAG: DNA-processing protein DprA [Acutalibacteraceae bacterium]|nr:DNA-processing protein DprA [Acutalibacteraceae bacterium]
MIKYWLWVSLCLDIGSAHLKPLLNRYSSPQNVYNATIKDLEGSYILSPKELERARNKGLGRVEKIISDCKESGIEIIAFDDDRYPENLREISDPPACLYVKGKLTDFSKLPIVCIVGTRKITDYGRMVAWSLAGRLAAGNIVILSGGAIGGDTAVHEGAMAIGGKTIAVLPCGINYDYLKTNSFLRGVIADNGCLVSEMPPDTPLHKNAFQIRNRLLSGLSLGVVIVEAHQKSGALITANHALEQGRDVFVITGRPDDKNYAGSNALLRDGAKPVFTADDIFGEYINKYPNIIDVQKAKNTNLSAVYKIMHSPKIFEEDVAQAPADIPTTKKVEKIKKNIDEALPNSVKIVYNYIDNDLFTIDDLLGCGLSFEEVMSAVTQLELYGYVKAIPGGRYSIIY